MILFSLLLLLGFFSCEKEQNNHAIDFRVNENFELKFDQTGHCTCGDFAIKFSGVLTDSRCPAGAICILPGFVTVELKTWLNGVETDREMTLPEAEGFVTATDTVGNFVMHLFAVNPYPQLGKKTELDDYRLILEVTPL